MRRSGELPATDPQEDALWPLKMRAAVASIFVAGLELAQTGIAETAQDQAFGAIRRRAGGGD